MTGGRTRHSYGRHNFTAFGVIAAAIIGVIVENHWVTFWLVWFGACVLYVASSFVEDLRDEIAQSMRDANDEFQRLMSQREDD